MVGAADGASVLVSHAHWQACCAVRPSSPRTRQRVGVYALTHAQSLSGSGPFLTQAGSSTQASGAAWRSARARGAVPAAAAAQTTASSARRIALF